MAAESSFTGEGLKITKIWTSPFENVEKHNFIQKKPSPLVKVVVDGAEVITTTTKSNTLSPVWIETHRVPIKSSAACEVEFQLIDHHKFHKNATLGTATATFEVQDVDTIVKVEGHAMTFPSRTMKVLHVKIGNITTLHVELWIGTYPSDIEVPPGKSWGDVLGPEDCFPSTAQPEEVARNALASGELKHVGDGKIHRVIENVSVVVYNDNGSLFFVAFADHVAILDPDVFAKAMKNGWYCFKVKLNGGALFEQAEDARQDHWDFFLARDDSCVPSTRFRAVGENTFNSWSTLLERCTGGDLEGAQDAAKMFPRTFTDEQFYRAKFNVALLNTDDIFNGAPVYPTVATDSWDEVPSKIPGLAVYRRKPMVVATGVDENGAEVFSTVKSKKPPVCVGVGIVNCMDADLVAYLLNNEGARLTWYGAGRDLTKKGPLNPHETKVVEAIDASEYGPELKIVNEVYVPAKGLTGKALDTRESVLVRAVVNKVKKYDEGDEVDAFRGHQATNKQPAKVVEVDYVTTVLDETAKGFAGREVRTRTNNYLVEYADGQREMLHYQHLIGKKKEKSEQEWKLVVSTSVLSAKQPMLDDRVRMHVWLSGAIITTPTEETLATGVGIYVIYFNQVHPGGHLESSWEHSIDGMQMHIFLDRYLTYLKEHHDVKTLAEYQAHMRKISQAQK